jgi:NitT/TauT family transport system permease protein
MATAMTALSAWSRRLPVEALLAAALGAVVWEALGRAVDFRFLPPLTDVIERLVLMATDGDLLPSLAVSLVNLAIGFSIAVVIGLIVGTLMGISRRVYAGLDMYVHAFLIAPSIIFAPIFFSMFGLGRQPVIAVIVMFAVFKIIISTAEGVRSAPTDVLEMARSYGASRLQSARRIYLPAAAPLTLAAVRIGAGAAVQGMVIAEMFIAVIGLGEIVMRAGRRFDAETVLATVIVLVVIATVLMALVRAVDRRLTSWLPPTSRARSEPGRVGGAMNAAV